MFETTAKPKFTIRQRMLQERHAFVTWTFSFELQAKQYAIEGASHITFGPDGQVTIHRDYWDAAEELFQKLPVIGGLFKLLRRRFRPPERRISRHLFFELMICFSSTKTSWWMARSLALNSPSALM